MLNNIGSIVLNIVFLNIYPPTNTVDAVPNKLTVFIIINITSYN